jgi:ABC-type transport system substrate-binding protein/DNA-binding SARP family transcriptional activator
VEFAILGPTEVRVSGRSLALGGKRPRALLALLLLNANEVVSRDRLVDGIWGEHPPTSASRTLDTYVSRLRTLVGPGRIERRAPGYLIHVAQDELDLTRFEQLVEDGRSYLAARESGAALEAFDRALALWHGTALADLIDEPFAAIEAARLEERRVLCCEERIDALLSLGRGPEAVSQLEMMVAAHPYRERLLGQLMVALYRAGRQADALAAFQGARRRFASELGLEPSESLRRLERQILGHDPALGRAVNSTPLKKIETRRKPTARVALGVVLAVVAACAGIAAALETRGTGSPTAGQPTSAFELVGGTHPAGGAIPLGDAPAAAAAGAGSIWLAEPNAGALVRVGESSRSIVERIPIGGSPSAVAFGGGAVWVASVSGGTVFRIDPATDAVTGRIGLGSARPAALAFGHGKLWIADATDDALLELDPADDTVIRTLQLDFQPTALAVGDGGIWVTDYNGGTLTELDSQTGAVIASTRVGSGPTQVMLASDSVWVANGLDSTVSRVDPATGTVTATTAVGSGPASIISTPGAVWVASTFADTVSELDPVRASVVRTIAVNGGPTVLVAVRNNLWVATGSLTRHTGGTVVLLYTRPIFIDPALNLDLPPFQSDGLTRDGLVTYDHTGGPAGAQLVPDLALALPIPTQGGTVYSFHLRPGIRYSSGRLVQASDFRRAFERLFRLGSAGSAYFTDLVGANACTRSRCNLSQGVAADDRARTVTIHLVGPDADFLSKLTFSGLSTPVPPGTPWHNIGWTPIPGTGPYEIANANRHEIRYVRNPYFREWSHAAQPNGNPDVIIMRFGLTPAQEVRAIERGEADWSADGVPPAALLRLTTQFPAQLHSFPQTGTDFLQINTTIPPFNNLSVRRALSYAVNRATVARFFGGALEATPTCQLLPPGLLGYRSYCPYTRGHTMGRWLGPNLAKALRLVAASGTRGDRITIWGPEDDPLLGRTIVPYIVAVLRRLGYRARAHLIPLDEFAGIPQRIFKKIQMTPPSWGDPTASNFFETFLICGAAFNHDWYCNRGLDRAVQRAEALEVANPRAAAAEWARLDREVVDRAAIVPLVNPDQIDFISTRVGNYQHNPIFGIVADQLWVNGTRHHVR